MNGGQEQRATITIPVLFLLPRGMFVHLWRVLVVTDGYVDQSRYLEPAPDISTGPLYVDRKLDLPVKELKRLGVAVAGIQVTKWFGNDVWSADGLLHSGRPLLYVGEPQMRTEGVGILLDSCATVAWGRMLERAGKPSVFGLKVVRCGQKQHGGSRETRYTYIDSGVSICPNSKNPSGCQDQVVN